MNPAPAFLGPTGEGGPSPLPAMPARLFPAAPLRRLLAALSLLAAPLHAHHGRDFILIQDSAIPPRFGGVALAGYEWTRDGDSDEFSTEPGFFVGLAPALAFGVSAGFSDSGDGWAYTGVTPQVVISLLPATGPRNLRVGLWAGYEFAESAGGGHEHGGSQTHVHDPGTGPDAGGPVLHDHGSTGSDHGHDLESGIHRHGESGLHSRLIVEADLTARTRAVLNLISYVSGSGGKPGFGYALGVRHEFHHDLSLGLEALGDFEARGSSHQVLATAMIGLPGHLALRLGAGAGLTRSAPDFTLHTSLLFRF